ncbi:PREDICTED: protein asteroid homolog 1-like [Amphimedon queenslandica]|uniref:Uncharacterized protein n=1 Tax=Amphimedon queenslandica TaxID=400682 RepID=A0A1X7UN78_AMPQE|nr:PREDICTED: protein asteroid homolog 1-like [Amphimedon queenslandica]|eukprot:XP_019853348.1 PREDICTED: protein asteroid homolog 1-like [Amphimedon queenslandica]
MGIQYLTTLINNHYPSKTWRTITPRGKLVLDGLSVSRTVASSKFDWTYGGQYWELRDYFIRFFKGLRYSGIDPFVIFDGVDYNEEKRETILDRLNKKVNNVFDTFYMTTDADSVVPIFTDIVFCETLKELGVEFIFADGDADRDTARIANHYNCPVVANDSDYFIFNLKAGYIPLNCLYWDQQPVKAKLYERDQFTKKFFNHDRNLIYLIPAIMGNDFMKRMKRRSLSAAIADASQKAKKSGTEIKQDEKLDTLCYISTFDTVKDVMSHLSKICQDNEIRNIKKNYERAKELYDIQHIGISRDELVKCTNLKTKSGAPLPCILRQYRKGCFARSVMVVLVLNKYLIPVMIDNPYNYTAMRIGKHIRKCIYMILSPYLSKPTITNEEPLEESVSWTDVSHLNLPFIDDVMLLNEDKQIEVLCKVMKTPVEILTLFIESESKWKLVAVSLHYWSQHAHPDIHLIEALVLCFIHCSFDETVCPSNKVPDHRRDEKWLEALHTFAQWSCTYYDALRLNNVLMNPLPFMSPALLFNGKLVMHYSCIDSIGIHKRNILKSSFAKIIFDVLVFVCTFNNTTEYCS